MDNVILELKDLKKKFGNKEILKGVDLSVKEGEIVGYIGANGAGKSTTVKIMLGMLDGYEGDVIIFGDNIKAGSGEYKRRIGYVPEAADLYESLSIEEYLDFIGQLYDMDRQEIRRKTRSLIELFNMEINYNTRISTFSKGMRQKLLLISSLIHNPDILFLDEPLNGLDANSVMVVKELLAILSEEGKTIFYSSHIMDVVEKVSHRIVLLNEGKIVADGSFEELKERSHEGSLEGIFNDMTGFNNHRELALEIAKVIK